MQDVNLIVECDHKECPYNCAGECGKDVLYADDPECKAQSKSNEE